MQQTRRGVPLQRLEAGQLVPFGGDRCAEVGQELAAAFAPGDRLVVVHETGDLLHIPHAEHVAVSAAVTAASEAFTELANVPDECITAFFDAFASSLTDDEVVTRIRRANEADVADAEHRGRATGRLVISDTMLDAMVAGLAVWRDSDAARDALVRRVEHAAWTVEERRAPLGVVGFVFEGRPNVFADATGVLRTGNTVVLRIGSDALATARAIMESAVRPSLRTAGLPEAAVELVDSRAHAAGWALFSDTRLGLAVARGSGAAVAQLGAVARQHGVPVSLHGTGGAWLVVDSGAVGDAVEQIVLHSLDRKVCNTLNVCCVVRSVADRMVPRVVAAAHRAAAQRGVAPVLHATRDAATLVPGAVPIDRAELGTEWEWDRVPELAITVVDDVDDAVQLFNRASPRFAASLVGADDATFARFERAIDAPFVGNGFTRWVDGQFAFDRPELGLSNWQAGRLLARGGVLSGDSVHTIRTRALVRDHSLHR